jgi:hypothetical protein
MEGEAARAVSQAQELVDSSAEDASVPTVRALHPSWMTKPLAALPEAARAPLLMLLDPALARYAALSLEEHTGEPLATREAARPGGLTARTLVRRWLRPPASVVTDVDIDTRRVPVDDVFSRWPDHARRIEAALLAAPEPPEPRRARLLAALAACLAHRTEEAGSLAGRLERREGIALSVARDRWSRVLDRASSEPLFEKMRRES